MNEPTSYTAESQAESVKLRACLVKLTIVYAVVTLLVVAIATVAFSWALGLQAAGCSLIAWLGAAVAQFCSHFPRGNFFLMTRLMTSSMARVGIPFAALLIVKIGFPNYLDRGMVCFIVLFYLVGLGFELKNQMAHLSKSNTDSTTTGLPTSDKSLRESV